MKKLFVKCDDGSKVTFTMGNSDDPNKYVKMYINKSYVNSIVLQQYPKKDNEPIVYK